MMRSGSAHKCHHVDCFLISGIKDDAVKKIIKIYIIYKFTNMIAKWLFTAILIMIFINNKKKQLQSEGRNYIQKYSRLI